MHNNIIIFASDDAEELININSLFRFLITSNMYLTVGYGVFLNMYGRNDFDILQEGGEGSGWYGVSVGNNGAGVANIGKVDGSGTGYYYEIEKGFGVAGNWQELFDPK